MVYLGKVPERHQADLVTITKNIVKNIKPFSIKLTGIQILTNGYIALALDEKSSLSLTKLSKKLESNIVRLGGNPLKYKYIPHLTIASVPDNLIKKAYSLIDKISIKDQTFIANKLLIARENEDSNHDWPIVGKIDI